MDIIIVAVVAVGVARMKRHDAARCANGATRGIGQYVATGSGSPPPQDGQRGGVTGRVGGLTGQTPLGPHPALTVAPRDARPLVCAFPPSGSPELHAVVASRRYLPSYLRHTIRAPLKVVVVA